MTEPAAEWVIGLPAGPLRPYVDRYLGYRLAGFAPGIHRGLPSRHMTFIVGIGPSDRGRGPDRSAPGARQLPRASSPASRRPPR